MQKYLSSLPVFRVAWRGSDKFRLHHASFLGLFLSGRLPSELVYQAKPKGAIIMESAVGTIISIIALAVAYITYRAQVAPGKKQLHYAALAFDLIMPVVHDHLRPLIKIYLKGQELINPVVCVACIQNTGKSPIRREDFDGPLVIQPVEEAAIFRGGTMDCDPPNIFDFDHPDRVSFEVKRNKFMIGPTLLNPGDKFQLMYVADMVPDRWDMNVSCRIAGIEKVSRISPARDDNTMGHDVYIERVNSPLGDTFPSPPPANGLALNMWVAPVLASIGGRLKMDLKLRVGNRVIDDPHIFYAIIHNARHGIAGHSGSSSIDIELAGAQISHAIAWSSNDASESQYDSGGNVRIVGRRSLKIDVPTLQSGDLLRVYAITSGFCEKPQVKYSNFEVDDALIFRFTTEDLIDKNLAKIDAVNLLPTQSLEYFRHKTTTCRRWLATHIGQ